MKNSFKKSIKYCFRSFLVILISIVVFQACNKTETQKTGINILTYSSKGQVYISQWPDGPPERIAQGLEPSLSHTGNYIAYSSNIGDKKRIRISDLRNDNKWYIEDIHGAGFRPQWSPKENVLLFSSLVLTRNLPHRMIVIYNPFNKHKSAISIEKTNLYSPVWSPDGQSILAHDKENLYEWDLKGKLKHTFPLKEIFGDYDYTVSSVFRPSDDRKLWLFEASERAQGGEGQPGIFIFNATDNSSRKLTSSDVTTNSFSWGPDQMSVVVAASTNGNEYQTPQGDYIMQISLEGEILDSWHQQALTPFLYTFASKINR